MRALVQKFRGEFANINVLTAYLGFTERGYIAEIFDFKDLAGVDIDRDTIVVGGIPVVVEALERLGVTPPALDSVPTSLEAFARRKVWTSTMGEVRAAIGRGESIFAKPIPSDRKLFGGQLLTRFRDLISTASLPSDHPVVCSEPVEMRCEYRVFVTNGDIVGCRHYKGDFRRFPDFTVIDAAIRSYTDAPAGYGIDFAVTSEGETVLVEVNDGFSLGCYGLSPLPYSALLEARWAQLLGE
jgi:hypothetical protein